MSTSQSTPSISSVSAIRAQFPALTRTHESLPVAYFDGPGGTQVPFSVIDAVIDYLQRHNANTHWQYPTSEETDRALDAARHALADFLGASADEIAFGANMTTLTFHLARALGRSSKAGDEVIVTELDHHANIDTWRAVARERDLVVRAVPFHPETGQLDWSAFERTINRKTKIVAIGAASNALGTISDVKRAAALAREVGSLVFVDAVHYAPHVKVNVRDLDCDFLACSAYKFYGPHVGVLYGRGDRLQGLDVPKLAPSPDSIPERFETGTQNHEGIVGAAAAVDFLAAFAGPAAHAAGHPSAAGVTRQEALSQVMAGLHERASAQVTRLWQGLSQIRGVRVYGPPPGQPRTPTVSFTVDGMPADDVARALARRALFVSSGDFYAATVVERLGHGQDGLVRAGCACYTTDEEIDRLVEGVAMTTRG
jgi:cysteine desulfurase family protein (TIGR01976 family)